VIFPHFFRSIRSIDQWINGTLLSLSPLCVPYHPFRDPHALLGHHLRNTTSLRDMQRTAIQSADRHPITSPHTLNHRTTSEGKGKTYQTLPPVLTLYICAVLLHPVARNWPSFENLTQHTTLL
jgi:hypothetical protein